MCSIVKIDLNTEKSPGNPKSLVVPRSFSKPTGTDAKNSQRPEKICWNSDFRETFLAKAGVKS